MEKKKVTLSIALAVKNEESNIKPCLSSITDIADEIVVVDGGSTDRTIEIAKHFNAKVIETDNPLMFHINKEKALNACRGDWILQLDADEVVTEELNKEIIGTISKEQKTNGYYIPRKNYFLGNWMKKGGQYPDYVVRLVRNGYAFFPCKSVHEQISVKGELGYLHEPLLHYSYKTISEYWRKADIYTGLTANELLEKGIKKGLRSWFIYNLIKPAQTFWTLFFRHKGFVDGWRGFLFALFSSLHHPIAYRKLIKLSLFRL